MFGTLITQQNNSESMKFVEGRGPDAGLHRIRSTNKIRVSCELCRTRKGRCTGEPGGCNRCVGLGVECVYPTSRKSRKQRRASTRETQASSEESSSNIATPGNECPPKAAVSAPSSSFDLDSSWDDQGWGNIWTTSVWDQSQFVESPSTWMAPLPDIEMNSSEWINMPPDLVPVDPILTAVSMTSNTILPPDLDSCPGMSKLAFGDNNEQDGEPVQEKPTAANQSANQTAIIPPTRRCSCLVKLVSIVEDLSSKVSSSEHVSFHILLGDLRTGLREVAKHGTSGSCEKAPIFLLSMAAEYLSVICQGLVDQFCDGMVGQVCVSSYQLDDDEGLALLRGLIESRIQDFNEFVGVLRSRAGSRPSQLSTLTEAAERVSAAKERLMEAE